MRRIHHMTALLLLAQASWAEEKHVDLTPVRPSEGHVAWSVPVVPPRSLPRWTLSTGVLVGAWEPLYRQVGPMVLVRRKIGSTPFYSSQPLARPSIQPGPWSVELLGGRFVSDWSPALRECPPGGTCSEPERRRALPGALSWFMGGGAGRQLGTLRTTWGGWTPGALQLDGSVGGIIVSSELRDPRSRTSWDPGVRIAVGVGTRPHRPLGMRLEVQWVGYRSELRGEHGFSQRWWLGWRIDWSPSRPSSSASPP